MITKYKTPNGVIKGHNMLYTTIMQRIISIFAYCSPNWNSLTTKTFLMNEDSALEREKQIRKRYRKILKKRISSKPHPISDAVMTEFTNDAPASGTNIQSQWKFVLLSPSNIPDLNACDKVKIEVDPNVGSMMTVNIKSLEM